MYEFTCQKCGQVFEELMTVSELETDKPDCPACGSGRIQRSISAFATNSSNSVPSCGNAPGGCGGGGGFT